MSEFKASVTNKATVKHHKRLKCSNVSCVAHEGYGESVLNPQMNHLKKTKLMTVH